MNKSNSTPNAFSGQNKDKGNILKSIRNRIEISTGKTISQLKSEYAEHTLFFLALQYISTSKKAVCEALDIPVEGACRAKRRAEKEGLLVQSTDRYTCPYTGHLAHKITTNPDEFERLRKSADTQLSLPNF